MADPFNAATATPITGDDLQAGHRAPIGRYNINGWAVIPVEELFDALLRLVNNLVSNDGFKISSRVDTGADVPFTAWEYKPPQYGNPPGASQKFAFTITEYSTANNPNTRHDVVMRWGYNPNREGTPADHAFYDVLENAYGPTQGQEQVERYWEAWRVDGTQDRPFNVIWNRITGTNLINLVSDNTYLTPKTSPSGTVNLNSSGALLVKTGTGAGTNGAFTIQSQHATNGSVYLNIDHTSGLGMYLDMRSVTDSFPLTLLYSGAGSQTRKRFAITVDNVDVFRIENNGAITPASLADSAAANGTIYYSTTAAKLVYKDSGGVVRNLY